MSLRRALPILGLVLAVCAVQLFTAAIDKTFYLTQLTMTAYYGLVIIGLCLLMGYTGQISLGHAGFFAMGGYVSAFLTTHDLAALKANPIVSLADSLGLLVSRQGLYGETLLTVHPWAACALAVLVTAFLAWLVGGPVLKLKGHYLAMATLSLGIIVYRVALGSAALGAADGISDVPAFAILPGVEITGKASARVLNYYVAWGLVALAMAASLSLVNSRVGRALRAIHGAEDAARSSGINTARYKLQTFVLSAALASFAGVFLTHYSGGIGPAHASVMASVRFVAIVAVGGMASLWGSLVMGSLLNLLSLRGYFGTLDEAVFGVILIVIMLFAPDGILGWRIPAPLQRLLPMGKKKV